MKFLSSTTEFLLEDSDERWGRIGRWMMALMFCMFAFILLHNYYLKPYSDPLNWITYAKDLHANPHLSKYPVAYALFLRFIMPITGPYYVFLSNLPILLVVAALVAYLTSLAATKQERISPLWLAVGSLALMISFEPGLWVYLVNPYRDPLSHAFLFGSILLFLRYLRREGQELWSLVTSALFLGIATSIRETSILVAVVLAMHGFLAWRSNRRIPLSGSILWFAVFLVIGLLPLLVHAYLRTGQALLPATSAVDGHLVPGMHFKSLVFLKTFSAAWHYYRYQGGLLFSICFIAGVVFSFAKRNTIIRNICLPSALIYFIFYSFYWTFVRRYLFIATLFSIPVAVYGLYSLIDWLVCAFRRSTLSLPLQRLATVGLFVLVIITTFKMSSPDTPFQIREAKTLVEDIKDFIPRNATVLAPRPASEVFSYFLGVNSYFIQISPESGLPLEDQVLLTLKPLLQKPDPVYYLALPVKVDHLTISVNQVVDAEPVLQFHPAKYKFENVMGQAPLTLYRLHAWTQNVTKVTLTNAPMTPAILRINAKLLWNCESMRHFAKLKLQGVTLREKVLNGANYFWWDPSEWPAGTSSLLELSSDTPLPSSLGLTFLDPHNPILLDFAPNASPQHESLLSDDFVVEKSLWDNFGPRWGKRATFCLPQPYAENDLVCAVFRVRARPTKDGVANDKNVINLSFLENGNQLASFRIRETAEFITLPVRLPPVSRAKPFINVDVVAEFLAHDTNSDVIAMEVDAISLQRVSSSIDIDVGDWQDVLYIGDGFYSPEHPNGSSFRWTSEKSEMTIPLRPLPDVNYQLSLSTLQDSRPTNAPPRQLKAVWNGMQLDFASTVATNGTLTYTAEIPANKVQTEANHLTILCVPWTPKDFTKSQDSRHLGVMLSHVRVAPLKH